MRLIQNNTYEFEIKNCSISDLCYQNCNFTNLVVSDISCFNIKFVNCKFDHVFIESSFFNTINVADSLISSLSIRGNREITSHNIFRKRKNGSIEMVDFSQGNLIKELKLCGNLNIKDCKFPNDNYYIHFKEPYKVYKKVLDHILNYWKDEKLKIGMAELEKFYLAKQVENQNEDFISYAKNDYLDDSINNIIFEVFNLIRMYADKNSLPS